MRESRRESEPASPGPAPGGPGADLHPVELAEVEAGEAEGGPRVRVRVRSPAGAGEGVARRSGGGPLRMAAEATVEAVRSALGRRPELEALDGEWVIIDGVDVVLLARGGPDRPRREPLGLARAEGDARRSAASAVLDAVNRLLRRGA